MRSTLLCAVFFTLLARCSSTTPEMVAQEQASEFEQNQQIIAEQQSEIEAEQVKAEFWTDSPLTKSQYEEDAKLIKEVTPQQWDAIRSLNVGLTPSKEDDVQLSMLTRLQIRAILETAAWLKWKNHWEAQKKIEIQADYNNQQAQQFEQQELNLRRFEALEAARPRTTNCYKTLFGGASCTEN
jgi:hypothetical protein